MLQLWSFNFLYKMMQAANCVQFCLNPFCCKLYEGQSIIICSQNLFFQIIVFRKYTLL